MKASDLTETEKKLYLGRLMRARTGLKSVDDGETKAIAKELDRALIDVQANNQLGPEQWRALTAAEALMDRRKAQNKAKPQN